MEILPKVQKARTPRSKVTCSDIRQARVLAQASIGTNNRDIAKDTGLSETYISRVLRSEDSQAHLAQVIANLNNSLNDAMPILLQGALNKLTSMLDEPYISFSDRLKTVQLILNTATRLSELSIRAAGRNTQ